MSLELLKTACEIVRKQPAGAFRSKTARVGEVSELIEQCIENGISQSTVYQGLRKAGIDLTDDGFVTARRRLRARKRGATDSTRSVDEGVPSAQSAPAPESQAESLGEGGDKKDSSVGIEMDSLREKMKKAGAFGSKTTK